MPLDPPESMQAPTSDPPASPGQQRSPSPGAGPIDPQALLAKLWKQNLPLFRERVSFLEQTASEHAAGHMTAEARTEAGNLAHKLAGSLGMFGYGHGTDVARELEQMLDAPESPDAGHFTRLTAELRATLPL